MADTQADTLRISSARPELTRAVMDKTGLDQGMLTDLVHRFYGKVRADIVFGPIFASRINIGSHILSEWLPSGFPSR